MPISSISRIKRALRDRLAFLNEKVPIISRLLSQMPRHFAHVRQLRNLITNIYHPPWQMLLVPLALVLFAAFVNAEPAINEARPHSNRPGRFLSLPVPQKCANRKYLPASAELSLTLSVTLFPPVTRQNFVWPHRDACHNVSLSSVLRSQESQN